MSVISLQQQKEDQKAQHQHQSDDAPSVVSTDDDSLSSSSSLSCDDMNENYDDDNNINDDQTTTTAPTFELKEYSKEELYEMNRARSTVSFGVIAIREYERIIGNHPDVAAGPPLSLGWNYVTVTTSASSSGSINDDDVDDNCNEKEESSLLSIDDYEESRLQTRALRKLTSITRTNLMKQVLGIATDTELEQAIKEVAKTTTLKYTPAAKNSPGNQQLLLLNKGERIRRGRRFIRGAFRSARKGVMKRLPSSDNLWDAAFAAAASTSSSSSSSSSHHHHHSTPAATRNSFAVMPMAVMSR